MASIVGGPSGALVPGHARTGLECGRILATFWIPGANPLNDILQTVKELTDRGVTLVSVTDGIDSSTAAGRMMIGVLGSLAEYERELTKERTALKRATSRANGSVSRQAARRLRGRRALSHRPRRFRTRGPRRRPSGVRPRQGCTRLSDRTRRLQRSGDLSCS